MRIPKQPRETDKAYLNYVKKQSCLICRKVLCDAHHTKSVGTFGSDYKTICLCREHHSELHQIGRHSFEERYAVNLNEEVVRLLINYIGILKAKP